MKKFRILYWVGTCVTDCYLEANDFEEARKKFADKRNGYDGNIVKIIEV